MEREVYDVLRSTEENALSSTMGTSWDIAEILAEMIVAWTTMELKRSEWILISACVLESYKILRKQTKPQRHNY